jgi:hypothetical protein
MKSSELLLGYPKGSYEIIRALAFLCVDEIACHCRKANQTSSLTTWLAKARVVVVVSGTRISIIRGRTRGPELMGPRAASLKLWHKFCKRSGLVSSRLETSKH